MVFTLSASYKSIGLIKKLNNFYNKRLRRWESLKKSEKKFYFVLDHKLILEWLNM